MAGTLRLLPREKGLRGTEWLAHSDTSLPLGRTLQAAGVRVQRLSDRYALLDTKSASPSWSADIAHPWRATGPAEAARTKRVIDAFTFFREFNILDWRLHELDEHVDEFVLVEAPVTFSGQPKPLHFQENQQRYARFLPKIRHVVVGDMPGGDDPWVREHHQRSAIYRQLQTMDLDPADVIVISDLDEVIDSPLLNALRSADLATCIKFRPHWFNFSWDHYLGPWTYHSIRVTTWGHLVAREPFWRGQLTGIDGHHFPEDTGWHAAYFASPQHVFTKLDAYSHAFDNRAKRLHRKGLSHLERFIRKGKKGIFGERSVRPFSGSLPRFAHLASKLDWG